MDAVVGLQLQRCLPVSLACSLLTADAPRFSYVVVAAAEIQAITEIFRFQVPTDYLRDVGYPDDTVEWQFGLNTNPAVWVGIFLLVELFVNLLPVRQYGRLEYLAGCIKISFLVALIMINVVLNARKQFHSDRFWTYNSPWGFSTSNFTARPPTDTDPGIVLTGSLATFTALWTTMVTSFFSLMGWDVVLLTAPENRDLQREETVKISSRKIALRVIVLYALAVFAVGLNIPYTDSQLRNLTINGIDGGQTSAFVLVAIREHVPRPAALPQTASTCSPRVLPASILYTRRLESCTPSPACVLPGRIGGGWKAFAPDWRLPGSGFP